MDAREGFPDTRVKDIAQLTTDLGETGEGVLTAEPSDTVFECIERMADRDVGSIVVMEGDAIVGIFTERDYMRKIALKGRSSKETKVGDVMTSKVATVQPDDSLVDGLRIMTEIWCRHLPVVNDDEDLIGIVSIRDGVEEVINNAEQETDLLLQYINGQYSV